MIGVDLVALDDVVGCDFFAGVGIECGSADLDTRQRSGDIFGLQLPRGATLFETRATGQNSPGHLITSRLFRSTVTCLGGALALLFRADLKEEANDHHRSILIPDRDLHMLDSVLIGADYSALDGGLGGGSP